MFTADKSFGARRLVELIRTVDSLNGQLREMQGELSRAKTKTFAAWRWRILMKLTRGQDFMSAVCNRRARPNTRMLLHADSRL